MAQRTPIVVGNWKLNKLVSESLDLVTVVKNYAGGVRGLEIGVAPPFTALWAVHKRIEDSPVKLAAQNCHHEPSGAFTGEISVGQLADVGCEYVIIGHSERRQLFGETDESVNRKVHAALSHPLRPILCIGETLEERESERTFEVLERQLTVGLHGVLAEAVGSVVIAYEPVWAIGTGKVATTAQAQEAHEFIRGKLAEAYDDSAAQTVRIQYGGSVKPDNVAGLMAQPDIDGALVGGASLQGGVFIELLKNIGEED